MQNKVPVRNRTMWRLLEVMEAPSIPELVCWDPRLHFLNLLLLCRLMRWFFFFFFVEMFKVCDCSLLTRIHGDCGHRHKSGQDLSDSRRVKHYQQKKSGEKLSASWENSQNSTRFVTNKKYHRVQSLILWRWCVYRSSQPINSVNSSRWLSRVSSRSYSVIMRTLWNDLTRDLDNRRWIQQVNTVWQVKLQQRGRRKFTA